MFFLFFLFLVVVVMLNLLIAIMSDSYERVKDGEELEARKLTAQTIIDEEAMMSQADRDNPEYFPPYLEVLRANEPPEVVWSGVSGQISRLDAAAFQRDKKLRAEVSEVRAQVAGVEGTVAEVSAKVAGVEGKVDALDQKLPAYERAPGCPRGAVGPGRGRAQWGDAGRGKTPGSRCCA